MTFKLYDVEGVDRPLRLSDEHAEAIGATVHVPDAAPADEDAPKPGSKDDLIARAAALGLPTDGTKAELEARIAEVS